MNRHRMGTLRYQAMVAEAVTELSEAYEDRAKAERRIVELEEKLSGMGWENTWAIRPPIDRAQCEVSGCRRVVTVSWKDQQQGEDEKPVRCEKHPVEEDGAEEEKPF